MKVRLLSLNIDKNTPFARYQARVVSSVKAYLNEGETSFEHFERMKDLFDSLQDALENDELIITAVDEKNYLKLKYALAQALGTGMVVDSQVKSAIEQNGDVQDEKKTKFASFPKSSTVFLSKDGLYSGFGIENGSQYLLLIPIDNDRINLILRNGVIPFLSKNIKLPDEDTMLVEDKHFENEKVSITVKRLLEANSMVAVNGSQNVEVLKSCGDNIPQFDNVFVFTPYIDDKGEVNATEYAAQLAKVSLDLSAANIGASISDVYETSDSKYICVAVADEKSALVRKLYMAEDETEEAFIISAALELIEIIGEKAAGLKSVGIEVADPVDEMDSKKKSKKGLIVFGIVLGVVVLVCAILGIVYKVQGENGFLAQKLNALFGTETSTTTTTTTPSIIYDSVDDPEDNTPVVKNKKISDMMVEELKKVKANQNSEGENIVTNNKDLFAKPSVITVNGEELDAVVALTRLVTAEMNLSDYNVEAIKAQAVVIYTFLAYREVNYRTGFVLDGVEISQSWDQTTYDAVESVFGEVLIDSNNNIALTPYFEVCAEDKTVNFDHPNYPYLNSYSHNDGFNESKVYFDTTGVQKTYSIKKGELSALIQNYFNNKGEAYVIDTNWNNWISVVNDETIKYVTVCGKEVAVEEFFAELLDDTLPMSYNFTVDYTEDEIVFTYKGFGYGVGMSKFGANHLAETGLKYNNILKSYFVDTRIY